MTIEYLITFKTVQFARQNLQWGMKQEYSGRRILDNHFRKFTSNRIEAV